MASLKNNWRNKKNTQPIFFIVLSLLGAIIIHSIHFRKSYAKRNKNKNNLQGVSLKKKITNCVSVVYRQISIKVWRYLGYWRCIKSDIFDFALVFKNKMVLKTLLTLFLISWKSSTMSRKPLKIRYIPSKPAENGTPCRYF